MGEQSQLKRRGRPRFVERWTVADTGYSSPCWLSTLAKSENGYARERRGAQTCYAHRIAYEGAYGEIPAASTVDHLCRVRACVNPGHLEAVSHTENVRRGRATKLTADDVAIIRGSVEKHTVLARRFGVTPGHISRIRNGLAWRTLTA